MAAEKNPYMSENEAPPRRRGAHFATPPAPEPYEPPRRKRSNAPIVLILLLAALVAGGFLCVRRYGTDFTSYPVIGELLSRFGSGEEKITVTVNGEETKVAAGSTVQAVFDSVKPGVTPGNLLSVGGNVIGEGQGDAFSATLDGQSVLVADAASTVVTEGSDLSFGNGADLTEDYTSEVTVTSQPKLVRSVKEGTGDAGYMAQQGTVQYVYQWGRPGTTEVRTGSISGESVNGEVVEGQDLIIMCQDIHPDNDEKLVALTFDDGPTYYTEQYLDILQNYGVPATFNLIGEQVADYAEVEKRSASMGNQLTSHTWHHPDLTTLTEEDLHTQLADAFDVISSEVGVQTTTIRPPYGDIDINVWLKSRGIMTLSVYWTHDSEDWKLPGVDAIVSNCTSNMAPGSVILMHDGGGDREQDLEALPRIIEAWKNAGYTFVTVEELMASDSSIPAECCANYRAMPEDAVWPTELAEEQVAESTASVG